MTHRKSLIVVLCSSTVAVACGSDPSSGSEAVEGGSTGAAEEPASASSGTETGPEGSEAEATVTYFEDVKPIIDARCANCHQPGEIGPFPLATYEEVSSTAELLVAVVDAGTMPPWPANDACAEFEHNPSLSDEQMATLRAWVDEGKAMGDPALEGEALQPQGAALDRVDFTIGMAQGHVPVPDEVGGIDEHVCFLLDWPRTDATYMTGFETHPGNRAALHHFVGLIVPPEQVAELEARDAADPGYGWKCGAGTGMSGFAGELFATWVPGTQATTFPEDTGLLVEPGSKILLNMHYNLLSGDDSPDQTMFDFRVEDEVEQRGRALFATNASWVREQGMHIPAGNPSVVHSAPASQFQLGTQGYTLHSLGMHMHTLGTRGSLFIERASGQRDCLLEIPRWDYDWQLGYRLSEPVRVEPGDALHIECEWDNSPANQPIVDGEPMEPVDVNWGEDTLDEMCLGMVYVTNP